MNTPNNSLHVEYVFKLEELRAYLDSVANDRPDDVLFTVSIGVDCNSGSEEREYKMTIEGASGSDGSTNSNYIKGCPKPPGCNELLTSSKII